MKIGILSLWNAASGMSIHAELVGREWKRQGHDIKVFAPEKHPDSRRVDQEDEDYVVRNYVVDKVKPYTREVFFDPLPLLDYKMDVFIVENLERMPLLGLKEIFPRLRKSSLTVQIVHEGDPSKDPMFYNFDFDIISCFDDRYRTWLKRYFPQDRLYIVPHPYHPWEEGNKEEARKKLSLPLNKKIIITYGWRHDYIEPVIEPLSRIVEKFNIMFLILAAPREGGVPQYIRELPRRYGFVEIREESPGVERLYTYLHASDLLLFYRENLPYSSVLSSSVYLCLGAGIPILFRDINMVEKNGDEIIKYVDSNDMVEKIIKIFEDGYDSEKVRKVVENQNSRVIAEKFIQIFEENLRRKFGKSL